jgi:valyl-tRNA synthetase
VLPGGIEASVVAGDAPSGDEADRLRLQKELFEAKARLAAAHDRLANPAFIEKAPGAVVDGARSRLAELEQQVRRLRERLGG